ncbi:unnamed protein product, partial [Polarella glacialis]
YRLLVRLGNITPADSGADSVVEASVDSAASSLDDAAFLAEAPEPSAARNPSTGELDCWFGSFSPELCCNVDQFGPGGNKGCWDGEYSFASCCTGILSDPGYWVTVDDQKALSA